MATKQKTRLASSLAKIDPPNIGSTLEHWHGRRGLKRICDLLTGGPLDTVTLHTRCGGAIDVLRERLREGVRAGIIRQQRRYTGIVGRRNSQLPALWHLVPDGIRAAAVKKPNVTSPIDALPAKLRRTLNEADWQTRGLTDHQAWRVANLIALAHTHPTGSSLDFRVKLNVDYATLRGIVKWAEKSGAIKVHRPTRKGVMGRPANRYEVQWDDIASWRSTAFVGRNLAPGRSPKTLGEMSVAKDRRTGEHRRWCKTIAWQATGLSRSTHWSDAERLLAAIGASRVTTNEKLAAEIGCGVQTIEKTVRRMKVAGLLRKRNNAGGERGRESEYLPSWVKIEQLAGEMPKASTRAKTTKAPSNGVSMAEPKKVRQYGPKGQYYHLNDWLVTELSKAPAKPYSLRERYKIEHRHRPLPSPRTFSALVSKARKKALKRATVPRP